MTENFEGVFFFLKYLGIHFNGGTRKLWHSILATEVIASTDHYINLSRSYSFFEEFFLCVSHFISFSLRLSISLFCHYRTSNATWAFSKCEFFGLEKESFCRSAHHVHILHQHSDFSFEVKALSYQSKRNYNFVDAACPSLFTLISARNWRQIFTDILALALHLVSVRLSFSSPGLAPDRVAMPHVFADVRFQRKCSDFVILQAKQTELGSARTLLWRIPPSPSPCESRLSLVRSLPRLPRKHHLRKSEKKLQWGKPCFLETVIIINRAAGAPVLGGRRLLFPFFFLLP